MIVESQTVTTRLQFIPLLPQKDRFIRGRKPAWTKSFLLKNRWKQSLVLEAAFPIRYGSKPIKLNAKQKIAIQVWKAHLEWIAGCSLAFAASSSHRMQELRVQAVQACIIIGNDPCGFHRHPSFAGNSQSPSRSSSEPKLHYCAPSCAGSLVHPQI